MNRCAGSPSLIRRRRVVESLDEFDSTSPCRWAMMLSFEGAPHGASVSVTYVSESEDVADRAVTSSRN